MADEGACNPCPLLERVLALEEGAADAKARLATLETRADQSEARERRRDEILERLLKSQTTFGPIIESIDKRMGVVVRHLGYEETTAVVSGPTSG